MISLTGTPAYEAGSATLPALALEDATMALGIPIAYSKFTVEEEGVKRMHVHA